MRHAWAKSLKRTKNTGDVVFEIPGVGVAKARIGHFSLHVVVIREWDVDVRPDLVGNLSSKWVNCRHVVFTMLGLANSSTREESESDDMGPPMLVCITSRTT